MVVYFRPRLAQIKSSNNNSNIFTATTTAVPPPPKKKTQYRQQNQENTIAHLDEAPPPVATHGTVVFISLSFRAYRCE